MQCINFPAQKPVQGFDAVAVGD
ncbi:hypothetical protein BOSE62_71229 [Bosea sp. 62]|nr:hypothetical protein BOSE21B_90405 [Bosea sp. 21B]CAD5296149.1 hypothetical protein BOSE46_80495 [Bosea sp. 46]CAD5297859.1 hypothetical protein BOSE7B_60262 [Bosea sp. 7B]VVT61052.1 hypothetical protein BOS5A_230329 [Bosea sp. EC-HK365B]VXB12661.1 hypothetical protein BOSE125_130020 [Bosea sp. 125]VXB30797.1 hypothetical protein BOSE127_110259 [Bosea sp. 127]VXC78298.1 hypothetical protein BOSE29B_80384 [Bosea sp. 29B]VXC88518.1 hypothetical protein BOSE62_71229 [Bosea sp. 62]